MLFSVIYDFDIPMYKSVREYAPAAGAWDLTERSDGEPSDWCGEIFDGACKHRKYCGILTKAQFEKFINRAGIFPEDVETMGSLGAPGCGYGLAPAISFRSDDPDAIQSAYVTPLPLARKLKDLESGPRRTFTEDDFERVRSAILRQYR